MNLLEMTVSQIFEATFLLSSFDRYTIRFGNILSCRMSIFRVSSGKVNSFTISR